MSVKCPLQSWAVPKIVISTHLIDLNSPFFGIFILILNIFILQIGQNYAKQKLSVTARNG